MRFRILLMFLVLSSLTVASAQEDVLTVVTHDSFNVSADVLAQFESETGYTVEILRSGDTGRLVNQAVLSAGNPLGDVLFGIDNTFLSRALENDVFVPYQSPMLDVVDERFILDEDGRVTPIDYGDVCLNYDIAYFEDNDLAVPQSLRDLTAPAYDGLLIAQNPATSSPGLAFLMATVAEFGEPAEDNDYSYVDFWTELVENNVQITDDWSNAYFGFFTQGSEDGTYPMVVSYASSPPFTYDEESDTVTTASIVVPNSCFRQIEFAGVLAGSENVEAAQAFIDFMLSETFQEDVPLQMFVFPVNENAELPDIFAEYAQIPDEPAQLDYTTIAENRETWISTWTQAVIGR